MFMLREQVHAAQEGVARRAPRSSLLGARGSETRKILATWAGSEALGAGSGSESIILAC